MKSNIFKLPLPAICAVSVLALCCLCTKTEQDTISFDEPEVVVGSTGGSTSFIVRSNTQWTLDHDADWFSLNITKGAQGAQIIVTYEDNPSETEPRSAQIYGITSSGVQASFTLTQMPLEPLIVIDNSSLPDPLPSEAGTYSLGITTNITSALGYTVIYQNENSEGWITVVSVTSESLTFKTVANPETFSRSAIITVSGADAFDRYIEAAVTVSQSLNMDPEASVEKDFGYARSLAPGEVSENIFVKGTVVADGKNPNFPEGRYTIQNASGEAVVFEVSEDLGIASGDAVSLWLLGSVIEEVTVPGGSYKLFTGIGKQHVMESTPGTPVEPRSVHIMDLNDDMLYSLVKLEDVEISIPFGAYVNYNEYYITGGGAAAFRENLTPNYGTSVRDINGDHIYMLTDFDVPYRRHELPQGSGSITGILVREENSNFGDMGSYQIRHLAESDIALAESRDAGFTSVLVEWDFTMPSDLEDGQKHIDPAIGPKDAEFFKNNVDGFYKKYKEGAIYFSDEYRGNTAEGATGTTIKSSAAFSANWDTETYWLVSNISTVGITTALSLQFESNSLTSTGPAEFVVEWSLDGNSWTKVENGDYKVMGQCTSKVLRTDHMPGYKPYDFRLPDALLDQPEVYIRLRCASDLNTSGEHKELPASATNRIGHLTIKYNK